MDPTLVSLHAGPPPPSGGRVVAGKYRLESLLGRGGRGSVYAAVQLDLARDVAVKLVEERDPEARARFLREARVAAGIHHPCVVAIFDAGVDQDGTPYCVMERLEGETLAERIEREGPLPPTEAVAVIASIASALGAVHAAGFLHRDVKPGNVFLARREDGGVDAKLIDFGIAHRLRVEPEVIRRATQRGLGMTRAPTATDIIVGTPLYLAPEQILGDALDERCDVYALGATLYEALSGEPPFSAPKMQDLLVLIVSADPVPLTRRSGLRVPAALDREVRRALAKERAMRPASPADFAAALWTAVAGLADHPGPAPRRRRRLVASIAAATVLLAAGLALRARRPLPPAPAAPPPLESAAPLAPPPAAAPPPPVESAAPAPPPPSTATPRVRPAPRSSLAPAPTATAAHSAAPPSTNLRMDDLKIPY
jgi:serine/threonine-protein kinase